MTAEELEELLSPKESAPLQKSEAPPISPSTTGPSFRALPPLAVTVRTPGSYIENLGVTLNSNHNDYYSYARNEREFTEEEKDMIRESILDYINSTAIGIRFDKRELQGLSRRVASHIEAYMYRWFPYMRYPKIECNVDLSPFESQASFSIKINGLSIATIGVRTR